MAISLELGRLRRKQAESVRLSGDFRRTNGLKPAEVTRYLRPGNGMNTPRALQSYLGASAVGIGRPYLWALGAFGQAGVEKVLDLLRMEFELAMKQCGARSVGEIKPAHVTRG